MKDITLHINNNTTATCIPNSFIDELMPDANGEYVKIYLYLLRCINSAEDFSISKLADKLDHTEKDIKRALAYWEKKHVLRLEYDSNGQLAGICFLDSAGSMPKKELTPPAQAPVPEKTVSVSESRPSYSKTDMLNFQQNENHENLLFIIERYIGHPLSTHDIESIMYWHQELKLSTDLIEYLVESCVDKGHKSLRYMEKVAINWSESSIQTVEEAKRATGMHSQIYYGIMKAFGISGRNLVDYELAFIDKWTNTFGFSLDVISEACKRTIQSTNQPSFQYADSILESWHKNHVHRPEDIAVLDSAYKKSKSVVSKPVNNVRTSAGGRFNNFPQRSYNYDQLEKQLLNSSNQ